MLVKGGILSDLQSCGQPGQGVTRFETALINVNYIQFLQILYAIRDKLGQRKPIIVNQKSPSTCHNTKWSIY